jgi:hypothetical protein
VSRVICAALKRRHGWKKIDAEVLCSTEEKKGVVLSLLPNVPVLYRRTAQVRGHILDLSVNKQFIITGTRLPDFWHNFSK